ncbi:hypothetical protein M068_3325 [Bacteroides fragilis str. J38-1]|nr:hypothetical protein M068_3325 [Bacteroides fragilis str. J38-1]
MKILCNLASRTSNALFRIAPILALIATIPFGPALIPFGPVLIPFLADTPSFLYRLHLQPFSSSCFLSSYYLI